MRHSSRTKILLITLVLFLVLVSVSCAGDTDMIITFDGNECIFEGPTEIETGDQIIRERNTSGSTGNFYICRIDEGYDWQDTLDFIGELGSEVDWPTWCRQGGSSKVVDATSDEVVHEFSFRFPGEHHVIWKQVAPEPRPTWPCAAFTVKESASE